MTRHSKEFSHIERQKVDFSRIEQVTSLEQFRISGLLGCDSFLVRRLVLLGDATGKTSMTQFDRQEWRAGNRPDVRTTGQAGGHSVPGGQPALTAATAATEAVRAGRCFVQGNRQSVRFGSRPVEQDPVAGVSTAKEGASLAKEGWMGSCAARSPFAGK